MTSHRSLRSHAKRTSSAATPAASGPASSAAKKKKPVGAKKTHAQKSPTLPTIPSASSLLNNSQQTTDEWYKSKRTKKGYANYVKSGKKWLVDWTAEGRLDDEISADAFDEITAETPLALRALTAYKCEHLERGFASAEGLRSAFKDYFERVRGCQGEFWRYNSHTEKWEGNPVFENGFKTYYESLKNRHNRTSTATQALPMLPADLKIILEYLDSEEAIKYFTVTQRLYFKAFATTAFTLWTRNDELINLQFKDIKLDLRSATGIPYHEFSLIFRKTNKDPNKVQKYMVQIDRSHPEIDCYTHVLAWKAHMEHLLRRPLAGADFIFPAFASTGQLKFGECASRSGFEHLMDDIVERCNVMKSRNGKFTTHCFRRGGAQYRFLWADRKWSLKAVKWWGGWSSNENVGTLMRYLLDELMAYEEGFSDIMMDDRVIDRHETFMGEDEGAPLLKADLARFEGIMLEKIQGIVEGIGLSTPPATPTAKSRSAPARIEAPLSAGRLVSPVPPSPLPLGPSRIPETKSLDDALEYWEHGSPQKGLNIPLKNWSTQFKSAEYASEAVKLGNIRFVCEEFQVRFGGDHVAFEAKFPGMRNKFTMLMKAIRVERKLRGETKSRRTRK
ncbi:hypothetical protein B0H15DRAFT_982779 [Mycena belliarum]|uniref:Tyr recombinase domain-containing protein n=1 Tax=Mycena belliarum TaxID=1033014 RepID=A0AAD6XQL8_9AGAR|nr:hypothetical protein B0H15DRAFT_982779 [Mycena belliae]